jgi:hypothetical protein
LIQSSLDPSKRELEADSQTTQRRGSVNMIFGDLFKRTSSSNNAKKFSNSTSIVGISSLPARTQEIVAEDDVFAEPELSVIIHDVKVYNLFYIDMFRRPKPYVAFNLGGSRARTLTKDADTFADWTDDPPLQLKIFHIPGSQMEIELDVIYEGYLSNSIVGSVKIPLNPYDPPSFKDKQFEISDFASSAKVLQASKKAITEGRSLPSVVFSMHCIHCGNA